MILSMEIFRSSSFPIPKESVSGLASQSTSSRFSQTIAAESSLNACVASCPCIFSFLPRKLFFHPPLREHPLRNFKSVGLDQPSFPADNKFSTEQTCRPLRSSAR